MNWLTVGVGMGSSEKGSTLSQLSIFYLKKDPCLHCYRFGVTHITSMPLYMFPNERTPCNVKVMHVFHIVASHCPLVSASDGFTIAKAIVVVHNILH